MNESWAGPFVLLNASTMMTNRRVQTSAETMLRGRAPADTQYSSFIALELLVHLGNRLHRAAIVVRAIFSHRLSVSKMSPEANSYRLPM